MCHTFAIYVIARDLRSNTSFLDLSSFPTEKKRFLYASEPNVDPAIADEYRAQSAADLTLFLKCRADELVDNGFGLYLMAAQPGAHSKHRHLSFLRKSKPVFNEAIENAALEFEKAGKSHIANLTRELLVTVKFPMFARTCEDISKTFAENNLDKVLELFEMNIEERCLDHKTGECMADFLWSLCKNSIESALDTLLEDNSNVNIKSDLASSIPELVRKQVRLISLRDFPDGRHYISYVYIVVKRRPRV